jgi:hypothetical protein
VAISYAIKKDTRSALLFRFVTRNNLERGADVQWLSMFPGESETHAATFLQRTRAELWLQPLNFAMRVPAFHLFSFFLLCFCCPDPVYKALI